MTIYLEFNFFQIYFIGLYLQVLFFFKIYFYFIIFDAMVMEFSYFHFLTIHCCVELEFIYCMLNLHPKNLKQFIQSLKQIL